MTFILRRALAAGALSAAALGATAVSPAMADDATSPECVTATSQLATAKADFVAARTAFVASNKPMGKLLAAERKAARTEVRTSNIAVRQLQKQAATTHDKATRNALKVQIRSERADIRHSTRLLDSKAALLTQARTDRAASKAAFAAARTAFEGAQNAAEVACADTATAQPTL